MRKGLILVMAAMFLLSLIAWADQKGKLKTINGTLSCMNCDLKTSNDARAQCKIYGHNFALKLEDGLYISFMENDHSEALINAGEGKWFGQMVTVTGTYYPGAHLIDVQNFKLIDKEFGWCEGHKAMDQCHAGLGHK